MEHRVNAMEQQTYKADAEIYEVLEREIIDLTIRPGSLLSENPLCARFGAPRSLIRVVLQRLQENGLVKIVPYKGTTVTRLNREIVEELIYERTAVEARVLRDFSPKCTPEQRALIRKRAAAYEELAHAEHPDFNRLYEADRLLHETWFAAMGKMYLWRTLQSAHADYSRFRMLDTMTSGGLAAPVTAEETVGAVSSPRLSITKGLNPTVVAENGRITYTFTIQNTGNTPVTATDDVILRDTFDPVLNGLTVTYNGAPWTAGTQYTYDGTTGLFATTAGQITVPAATYTQDPVTGAWAVTPGVSELIVTGTV